MGKLNIPERLQYTFDKADGEGRLQLRCAYENAKLRGQGIFTFSLPSGKTCPGAHLCHSFVQRDAKNPEKVSVIDGGSQEFRCFEVSTEARYSKTVLYQREINEALLRSCENSTERMAVMIYEALPPMLRTMRIHVGGDFFSQAYFDAWLSVAFELPRVKFYAYTKSLPMWVSRLGSLPRNLMLNASRGGKWDHMIALHKLKSVRVVKHPNEAFIEGLEIDHDDSHAHTGTESFALLLHGVGQKGSEHNRAIRRLKKEKIKFSYGQEQY